MEQYGKIFIKQRKKTENLKKTPKTWIITAKSIYTCAYVRYYKIYKIIVIVLGLLSNGIYIFQTLYVIEIL